MEPDNHDTLITKFLAEEISNSENEELNDWVKTNKANKEYFEQKKHLWQLADIEEDYAPDLNIGIHQLQNKIKQVKQPSIVKQILKFAAAAAILISLTVTSYHIINQSPNTVEITANHSMEIVHLPDNSKVWLNQGATISYNSDFALREVQLKGEAFFDIESNPSKPFKVHCRETTVKILGTSFVVREEPEMISISVLSGKVSFGDDKKEKIILTEGESAYYQSINNKLKKYENREIPSMEWRNIDLFFENQRLEDIIKKVSNYYGVTIVLKNKKLASCRLSGNLKNKSLKNIFELLKVSINLEVEEKENHVFILHGENCG